MSRPFEFDGVVRLTRIGTLYVIFTVVLGFAALNTGNNALYIALTFLLAGLLLSGMASKGGLRHLKIEVRSIDSAWAGKPADGTLHVTNSSKLWNVRDVVIISPELEEPVLVPIITHGQAFDAAARFLFHRRGLVTLTSVDCYTRYPFGFFLKKRRVRISGELIVYPRLLSDEHARARFLARPGEATPINRPGPGTELHGFRDYVRGDSLRHVYWKKSASLGRWIIKQTDIESGRVMHVAIDPYKPPHVSEESFERMVSEAATFIFHTLDTGLDLTMSLPRQRFEAQTGHFPRAIFRALALLEPTHEPTAQFVEGDAVIFSTVQDDAQLDASA